MLLWMALACGKSNINLDDFERLDIFCDSEGEAYVTEEIDGGAIGNSGRLEAQLMSNADYPRELEHIANATYILENLDVGGGESLGQASPLGEIETTRGEGNWLMRIEGPTGCVGEVTFEIVAATTLKMCIPVTCEIE
ncbi:MAG: hypothetical protein VX278_00155 [Myxococcota bacterium]|nr:hypothetical protein [Myxococcota bacterium]